MRKRQIKKTVVHYNQAGKGPQIKAGRQRSRSRSREKNANEVKLQESNKKKSQIQVEQLNVSSRRARMEAIRRAQKNQVQQIDDPFKQLGQIVVKIEDFSSEIRHIQAQEPVINPIQPICRPKFQSKLEQQVDEDREFEDSNKKILLKPTFISKQLRNQEKGDEDQKEEERKKRSLRYTTKLLLEQQKNHVDSQAENEPSDSENENQTDIPDDDDTKNEQYEFELWKIRQLKRIRRSQEERHKFEVERAELQRRRQMTNQQIMIENKLLGSDATDNATETKYVFMQKYYFKGAFYQDSDDEIFKRDYNLPTPMQLQDKSMLPAILQKRMGKFGTKGQSKYTHLTAQDTSDLNPLTRPDQSILNYWKKRTAGYKSSYTSNL